MPEHRRHLLTAGAAWAVLSVISVALVAGIQILPHVASREADIEDGAFVLLTAAAMPVLMFVVVGLAYSALRFRAGDEEADGPPIHGHSGVQAVWLGVSGLLVLGLFGYGAVGLLDIRGSQQAEYEIQVRAEQWKWHFTYPGGVESTTELHLPLDRRVRLVITSDDVIHSLWLDALGIKQDAVPGRETHALVSPTTAGTYSGMCAELCGLGHSGMTFTIVVQSQAELDDWLHSQAGPPA